MKLLPPHKPKYFINCDFANGKDVSVVVGVILKDGTIKIIPNIDED